MTPCDQGDLLKLSHRKPTLAQFKRRLSWISTNSACVFVMMYCIPSHKYKESVFQDVAQK